MKIWSSPPTYAAHSPFASGQADQAERIKKYVDESTKADRLGRERKASGQRVREAATVEGLISL